MAEEHDGYYPKLLKAYKDSLAFLTQEIEAQTEPCDWCDLPNINQQLSRLDAVLALMAHNIYFDYSGSHLLKKELEEHSALLQLNDENAVWRIEWLQTLQDRVATLKDGQKLDSIEDLAIQIGLSDLKITVKSGRVERSDGKGMIELDHLHFSTSLLPGMEIINGQMTVNPNINTLPPAIVVMLSDTVAVLKDEVSSHLEYEQRNRKKELVQRHVIDFREFVLHSLMKQYLEKGECTIAVSGLKVPDHPNSRRRQLAQFNENPQALYDHINTLHFNNRDKATKSKLYLRLKEEAEFEEVPFRWATWSSLESVVRRNEKAQ